LANEALFCLIVTVNNFGTIIVEEFPEESKSNETSS
jgi:hypothetical protein